MLFVTPQAAIQGLCNSAISTRSKANESVRIVGPRIIIGRKARRTTAVYFKLRIPIAPLNSIERPAA